MGSSGPSYPLKTLRRTQRLPAGTIRKPLSARAKSSWAGHAPRAGIRSFPRLTPSSLHTQLRITAKYMFIDSWDGESAYMKVNDSPVWADTYNHAQVEAKSGINVCGNGTPEGRFMRNIDVTVPHNGPTFDLKFGATTDEHSCDESFGVDSVMVFVR